MNCCVCTNTRLLKAVSRSLCSESYRSDMDDWICSRFMCTQPIVFSVFSVSSSLFAFTSPVSSCCHSVTLLPRFSLISFGFRRHTAWLRSHVATKAFTSRIRRSIASTPSSSSGCCTRPTISLYVESGAASRDANTSERPFRRGSVATMLTTSSRLSSHFFLLSATGGFTTRLRFATRMRCRQFSRRTLSYTAGSATLSRSSAIASSSCIMSAVSSRTRRRNATSHALRPRFARSVSSSMISWSSVWMNASML